MKKVAALVLTAVLLFALPGCAQRSPGQSGWANPSPPVRSEVLPLPPPPPSPPTPPDLEQGPTAEPPEFALPPTGTPGSIARPWHPTERRLVALTFDDGPGRYTDPLLDLLERHGGQATFFVLGYRVEGWRSTITRAHRLGNEIAGHSWDHPDFSLISQSEVIRQLQQTSDAIESITGQRVNIYRPPFGRTSSSFRMASEQLGYVIVNWTLDTMDWRYRDAEHIASTITSRVQPGDVIVMHDIYASTLEAMQLVIPWLVAEGFELVTASELLAYHYGQLEPGTVFGRKNEEPRPTNWP